MNYPGIYTIFYSGFIQLDTAMWNSSSDGKWLPPGRGGSHFYESAQDMDFSSYADDPLELSMVLSLLRRAMVNRETPKVSATCR